MPVLNKKDARIRRAKRARMKIRELHLRRDDFLRLCVTRSSKHIAAQLIKMHPLEGRSEVVACVSTHQADIKSNCKYTGNISAAAVVGKAIADKAKALQVTKVAFDRSGFKYHGRVKALADAAREAGLDF